MKSLIINVSCILALLVFIPTLSKAQGTTYLSNVNHPSAGSEIAQSENWLATLFVTGTNTGGYVLNSIQLRMANAFGNPSGFTAMLFTEIQGHLGAQPATNLCAFSGSSNPATAGIYSYTCDLQIILPPLTPYFIVVTTTAQPTQNYNFSWSFAGTGFSTGIDGWRSPSKVLVSPDGSYWSQELQAYYAQYSINATAVPEPSIMSLFGFCGLFLWWSVRKRVKIPAR